MIGALRFTAALLGGLFVAACEEEAVQSSPARPVRTVVVAQTADVDPIALTGIVRARDTVDLAFRIGGVLAERSVSVGERVAVGDRVARLETGPAENALRGARARLSAAQATLTQAVADLERQKELVAKGIVAAARNELAQQAEQSGRAGVEAAEAELQSALDNVGYTELKADTAGSVTAIGANTGEVVSAGQMIVQVALDSGKDAVFNVPLQLIRSGPKDALVKVALADDPAITSSGHVREVAQLADAATGTYSVKVGLNEPPAALRLGATVVGRVSLSSEQVVKLPGSALTQVSSDADVWVVNPKAMTVTARQVGVLRYESDAVVIGSGLADGEIVVTAGVHALRPGQEVRLLGRGQ
jgi:RND family efflux transporter MFP subunit